MTTEIWTIIGTGAALFSALYTIIRNFRIDFDTKYEKQEKKFEMHEQRWIETNKRMDGVYHILLMRIKGE